MNESASHGKSRFGDNIRKFMKVDELGLNSDDAARLEQAGADLILVPYADAAREAADRIVSPEFVRQRLKEAQ